MNTAALVNFAYALKAFIAARDEERESEAQIRASQCESAARWEMAIGEPVENVDGLAFTE